MVDVSRNVVAILLVLVIVVSGFGTYTALTTHPTVKVGDQQANVGLTVQRPTGQGEVGLTIEGNNNG